MSLKEEPLEIPKRHRSDTVPALYEAERYRILVRRGQKVFSRTSDTFESYLDSENWARSIIKDGFCAKGCLFILWPWGIICLIGYLIHYGRSLYDYKSTYRYICTWAEYEDWVTDTETRRQNIDGRNSPNWKEKTQSPDITRIHGDHRIAGDTFGKRARALEQVKDGYYSEGYLGGYAGTVTAVKNEGEFKWVGKPYVLSLIVQILLAAFLGLSTILVIGHLLITCVGASPEILNASPDRPFLDTYLFSPIFWYRWIVYDGPRVPAYTYLSYDVIFNKTLVYAVTWLISFKLFQFIKGCFDAYGELFEIPEEVKIQNVILRTWGPFVKIAKKQTVYVDFQKEPFVFMVGSQDTLLKVKDRFGYYDGQYIEPSKGAEIAKGLASDSKLLSEQARSERERQSRYQRDLELKAIERKIMHKRENDKFLLPPGKLMGLIKDYAMGYARIYNATETYPEPITYQVIFLELPSGERAGSVNVSTSFLVREGDYVAVGLGEVNSEGKSAPLVIYNFGTKRHEILVQPKRWRHWERPSKGEVDGEEAYFSKLRYDVKMFILTVEHERKNELREDRPDAGRYGD